jgi:L-amino acid N-acyltransferase
MSAAQVTIRDAVAADLPDINRIYNDEIFTGVATWDEEPWSPEKRAAWFAGHGRLTPVLIAERGVSFAGFSYLSLCSDKSGWRFSREDTIYIDPAFRGQGVGDVLLGALLERARSLELNHIVASITSTNEASLRLHAKHGFTVIGTQRQAGFKFGEWRDTTLMQRVLRD